MPHILHIQLVAQGRVAGGLEAVLPVPSLCPTVSQEKVPPSLQVLAAEPLAMYAASAERVKWKITETVSLYAVGMLSVRTMALPVLKLPAVPQRRYVWAHAHLATSAILTPRPSALKHLIAPTTRPVFPLYLV
eukprot:TRINITY_DN9597_c0_g1_i7.p4 TRINITY_DN9597_c0_g1~~TRINITY_DN9597_c0_g1_i7.p4  ORF type:complete len:133 (-),score=3.43 TRINITY_DN9597_c0_g1_i7:286-684(-)